MVNLLKCSKCLLRFYLNKSRNDTITKGRSALSRSHHFRPPFLFSFQNDVSIGQMPNDFFPYLSNFASEPCLNMLQSLADVEFTLEVVWLAGRCRVYSGARVARWPMFTLEVV